MGKLLLIAVAVTGFVTLMPLRASAMPAAAVSVKPAGGIVTEVSYWSRHHPHHHWHHRHWHR